MLKEIHEQADAVAETIADRTVARRRRRPRDLGAIDDELLRSVPADHRRRLRHVATTPGLIGRYAIEEWARVPVEMDVASEYRYRNPVVGAGRPRHRHHPVRRDRRHARRDAPGPRARRQGPRHHQRHGLAGHARRRRRALHARRPRDRRRRDEDVRLPGRGDVPARAAARRAARHARRPSAAPSSSPTSSTLPHCIDEMLANGLDRRRSSARPHAPLRRGLLPLPRPPRRPRRRRSRARSSSRRSPTSRPTPTRPAR